jgi:hypothetical protein
MGVAGFEVKPFRSIADRLGTSRLRGRLGWRTPRGRPPWPGSLGYASSGIGSKHHLCARRHTTSNWPRPLDPLRQPRRLPDPYAIMDRDEGVNCQLIVGEARN